MSERLDGCSLSHILFLQVNRLSLGQHHGPVLLPRTDVQPEPGPVPPDGSHRLRRLHEPLRLLWEQSAQLDRPVGVKYYWSLNR